MTDRELAREIGQAVFEFQTGQIADLADKHYPIEELAEVIEPLLSRVRAEAVEEAAQFCEKEWGAWTIAEAMRAALTKATKETKNV